MRSERYIVENDVEDKLHLMVTGTTAEVVDAFKIRGILKHGFATCGAFA
jgi:hypothetical protein